MRTYNEPTESAYRRRIEYISERTDIPLVENLRRGKKQAWHLEDIREAKAKMKRRGQAFKNPEGRPAKTDIVREWRASHPDGRKADCARDTGLDPKTIRKWWDKAEI